MLSVYTVQLHSASVRYSSWKSVPTAAVENKSSMYQYCLKINNSLISQPAYDWLRTSSCSHDTSLHWHTRTQSGEISVTNVLISYISVKSGDLHLVVSSATDPDTMTEQGWRKVNLWQQAALFLEPACRRPVWSLGWGCWWWPLQETMYNASVNWLVATDVWTEASKSIWSWRCTSMTQVYTPV